MKVISTWAVKDGAVREAVKRFLSGDAAPIAGVTLLGRWHAVDLSRGWSLYETDSPALLYEGSARWVELLDMESTLVIEDAEAGSAMAKTFKN
jgi:hypothetical protein